MTPGVRPPAVSGRFYPSDPVELRATVATLLADARRPHPLTPSPQAERGNVRAVIAPHAGYIYSGPTAARAFARVTIPGLVVILAPNHTGISEAKGGVSSGDLNHYEPSGVSENKDARALDAVQALDGEELLARCKRERISMCGRGPAAVVLAAAKALGGTRADVVDYRHSGWVSGDNARVVGYAGVVIP